MKKDKILLFIPAYNCERQILRVLNQVDENIQQFISEIIVVNNRSTDNTENVAAEYIASHKELNIKLLRNDENYGLGGSHKVAFKYATKNNFDYIIVLHGDDQGHIRDIMPVIQNGSYHNMDSCLGARFIKGSVLSGYSKFRSFGNRAYNLLFSIVLRKRVYDLGSGLNMYKVESLKNEYYRKYKDNLMFNYCMILAIDFYKQNTIFFPVDWSEDDQVSNVKMMSQALSVLKMLFSYAVNRRKFMSMELRDLIRENYTAQVIAETIDGCPM